MVQSHFAPAAINEGAVYWLNASQETRDQITKAGGSVPVITDDDRYVAAQRREAAQKAAAPKTQP